MYYDDYYDDFNAINQQQFYGQPSYFPAGEEITPMIAPPSFSPPIPAWQSGPSGIRRCINRNTYIWLRNRSSLWFFPTFVSRDVLIGFRWSRIGWTRSRINLRDIVSYQCF